MRFLCTIYTYAGSFTSTKPQAGLPCDPTTDSPVASIVVSGSTLRQAAARAYVRCVGRERARKLQQAGTAPAAVIAQETSCKAIALSLRKVHRRFGECYEMDNLHDVWSIKVEAMNSPRRLRLSAQQLYHLSRTSSPN